MFVPAKNLEKEKDHVEGFAAEVAWVTKACVLVLFCEFYSSMDHGAWKGDLY